MTSYVLDASAVLALIWREAGSEVVDAGLPSSLLSAVNASEVVTKLVARGAPLDVASQMVTDLACVIAAVDAELGLRAGVLYAATRSKVLSLGDRVCLALAEREGVPALTADRAWADLAIGIDVSLIR